MNAPIEPFDGFVREVLVVGGDDGNLGRSGCTDALQSSDSDR